MKRENNKKDDKGGRPRSKKSDIEFYEQAVVEIQKRNQPAVVERKMTEEKSAIETVKSGGNKLAIDEKNRVEIKVAKW